MTAVVHLLWCFAHPQRVFFLGSHNYPQSEFDHCLNFDYDLENDLARRPCAHAASF